MATLVTPPNTTTTLTASATYTGADLQGPLVIQGPAIDFQGPVTSSSYILLTTNGSARFETSAANVGSVYMWGSAMSVVFDAASSPNVYFTGSVGRFASYQNAASNSSVTLAGNATIHAFSPSNALRFSSPAVSFTYVDSGANGNYENAADVLTVHEQNGQVVTVSLYSSYRDIKATDLIVDDGAIVFRTPQPPVVTGTVAKQAVVAGHALAPFASTVVTDPNTAQAETVQVVFSALTGTLVDPNAATDGSTWNASTRTYTVTGLQADVTRALQGLVFTATPYTLSAGQTVTATATITVTDALGDSSTDGTTSIVIGSGLSVSRNDFDGNGTSDLMWQRSDGLVVEWGMNGAAVASGAIVNSLGPEWSSLGSGDFDGDGKTDLLWQRTDGLIVDWTMNGSTITAGNIVSRLDASWSLAARGDFNGDGRADLLWRNTAGTIVEWQMNGPTVSYGAAVAFLDPSIAVIGSGDFNGDGKTDLLFRDSGGHVSSWNMNGTSVINSANVASVDSSWSFLGTGDFNNDGTADALWRQSGTGLIAEWQMGPSAAYPQLGASVILASGPLATLDESWAFLGTGHFAGDASTQVVWRGAAGQIVEWTVSGFTVTAGAAVTTLDGSWKPIG